MSAQGAGARNLGILVMLVAALAAPGLALACSCVWGGPFVKVALRTDLIVLAEVRSYHARGPQGRRRTSGDSDLG